MPNETKSKKSLLILIIVVILIIVGAAAIYLIAGGKEKPTNTNTITKNTTNDNASDNTNINSATDPYADLMKYDGKLVEIYSADGKVNGQLAIAYRPTEKMPMQVVYFLKVTDDLPKSTTPTGGGAAYYYLASHARSDEIRASDGSGTLSAVICYADQTPDVLALARVGSITVDAYDGCSNQYDPYATTDTFYNIYAEYYNNYDFDYDRIVGKDTLALFDSAPYWTADPSTGGASVDDDTVIAQAEIARQYTLIYSE